MRSVGLTVVLLCTGCGMGIAPPATKKATQEITCDQGQVPVYKNRFQPVSGASGVAAGADAYNGQVSADRPDAPPVPVDTTPADDGGLSAMTVTCGEAACPDGQVAVEDPARAPTYGTGAGGISGGGDFAGDPAGGAPAPSPDTPPAPPATPPAATVCAPPPPDCAPGQSPQFTVQKTWECTDCSLVVTYGGVYGNYRRCVNAPTVVCGEGEVPTWRSKTSSGSARPSATTAPTISTPSRA